MANETGGSMLPFGLDLKTVILIVTAAAAFVGQWYTLGDAVSRNSAAAIQAAAERQVLAARLYAVERDVAVMDERLDNLLRR